MIVQPTSAAALTWIGAAAGASAEGWRIGSVLSARPLGFSEPGLLVLQIGALTVAAEAPNGQLPAQFQVRVLSLGTQPLLEVLGGTPAPDAFGQALRERLPQQNGYAPLLATLGALSQWSLLRQLPADLRTALGLLDHILATPAEIGSAEGLRQAIERSGLFLEARLAQPADATADPNEDLKGVLLRLVGLLRNQPSLPDGSGADVDPPLLYRGALPQTRLPPPELPATGNASSLLPRLSTDAQAALARLEIAQLQATAQQWMVELPVKDGDGIDVLQMLLRQNAEAEAGWTMGFALDLPALGPLVGEIHLRGLRLSVRLWAQRSQTVALLEQQFGTLRARLDASGLLLDQLSCQHGLPQTAGNLSAVFLKTTA